MLLQHTHHGLRIDAYRDSDWATCKRTQRSVSAGVVMVGQNLLYSSSHAQPVIALSSGEAELLASASCLCDGLFVRQLVAFLDNDTLPQVHRHLDAVAAKGMMECAGVGRVRHLSVRVLWIQDLVDDKTILLQKVPTESGYQKAQPLALDEPVGNQSTLNFSKSRPKRMPSRGRRTTIVSTPRTFILPTRRE